MTTPTPAAQALIDLFASQDPERVWALLPSVPLTDQDYALCHALEQGWDDVAAQVLRRCPELIQDQRTTSPWHLRAYQKLVWVMAWHKANRQSAEVLLASQKPFPYGWDGLGMTLRAGWDDLLEPMVVRLDDLQRLESHGLSEAIRLDNLAAFDLLSRHLEVTTQHALVALRYGRPEWADALWSTFTAEQLEEHLREGSQERDGRPKANPGWDLATVDAALCRLPSERHAPWQAWAAEHGLDLPQLRAQQRLMALDIAPAGSGRSRARS